MTYHECLAVPTVTHKPRPIEDAIDIAMPNNTYLTADTHWGHFRILEYCKRPFIDTAEMDAAMIAAWNAVVTPEDTVYHLGDLTLGGTGIVRAVTAQLNGVKHLIRGNHDRNTKKTYLDAGWASVEPHLWYKYGEILFVHDPAKGALLAEAANAKDPIVLHGHVHEKYREAGKYKNVGVDVRDFKPVKLEDLL